MVRTLRGRPGACLDLPAPAAPLSACLAACAHAPHPPQQPRPIPACSHIFPSFHSHQRASHFPIDMAPPSALLLSTACRALCLFAGCPSFHAQGPRDPPPSRPENIDCVPTSDANHRPQPCGHRRRRLPQVRSRSLRPLPPLAPPPTLQCPPRRTPCAARAANPRTFLVLAVIRCQTRKFFGPAWPRAASRAAVPALGRLGATGLLSANG